MSANANLDVFENKIEKKGFDFKTYSTLLALILIFLLLWIVTDGGFVSPRNFTNLSRQISINGILAVGMTMVILTGGIDLSVGSLVALAGVTSGILQVNFGLAQWGAWGTFLSATAGISVGLIAGTFN